MQLSGSIQLLDIESFIVAEAAAEAAVLDQAFHRLNKMNFKKDCHMNSE